MNIAVILSAGKSKRFGSSKPKQYLKINGKEMFYYSYITLKSIPIIDKVILVVDNDEYQSKHIAKKYGIECVLGGETRNDSIYNAIQYIKKGYPNCKNVVFQDASRPFVSRNTFCKIIEKLKANDAVAVAKQIGDTLCSREGEFLDRDKYKLLQTPEAIRFKVLCETFKVNSKKTAIITQIDDRYKKYYLENNTDINIKVSVPKEIFIAEQLYNTEYYSEDSESVSPSIEDVLVLGGSGGIGQSLIKYFDEHQIRYFAPSHRELDLCIMTVDDIKNILPFAPKVIINAAAYYANDDQGILEHFDRIMAVNVKANLVLLEYASEIKDVKVIMLSSSSSTRGREGLTSYSASKAAINSIVSSLSSKLLKDNVYLNAIIPEKVNTPLIGKLHQQPTDVDEMLQPETVVKAIMACVISDDAGKLIHIRHGM